MKDPTAVPEQPDQPSPWHAKLVTLLKPETTDHARGFNEGIRAALELLALHEQDRQRLSKKGLKKLKAAGKKTGGDVPYGYQLDADGTTLRPNLDEQRTLALVRELDSNHSLRGIAKKLREEKIFPRNYDPANPDSPDEFLAVQIRRMLDPYVPQFRDKERG